MKKLNEGAFNIRREFDGEHTIFTYDTPKKNGCVYVLIGEWEQKNGVLTEKPAQQHNLITVFTV